MQCFMKSKPANPGLDREGLENWLIGPAGSPLHFCDNTIHTWEINVIGIRGCVWLVCFGFFLIQYHFSLIK